MNKKDVNETLYKYITSPGGIFNIIFFFLSFSFALWSYSTTQQKPQLTFVQDPNTVTVVSTENNSNLEAYYKKNKIENGLVSSQISIWNAGTKNIRPEMVLEEVKLFVEQGEIQIYDVDLVAMNRNVVQFQIDKSDLINGVIPIKWRILEDEDGAILNILHSSEESVSFGMSGVIEDQDKPFKYVPENGRLKNITIGYYIFIGILGVLGIILIVTFFYLCIRFVKKIYKRDTERFLKKDIALDFLVIVFLGAFVFDHSLYMKKEIEILILSPYSSNPF